jgi:hypothetical protein
LAFECQSVLDNILAQFGTLERNTKSQKG